jgi:hypothetical protein
MRSALDSAASLLEVAGIEYAEAVVDGRVVKEVEFRGSVDAVSRSKARWQEVAVALGKLDPVRAAAIGQAYDEVEALMARHVPPTELDGKLATLTALLRGTPGPSASA